LNEAIVQGGVKPSLVNLFSEASTKMDNIVCILFYFIFVYSLSLTYFKCSSAAEPLCEEQSNNWCTKSNRFSV
jgi:hypothetical protein